MERREGGGAAWAGLLRIGPRVEGGVGLRARLEGEGVLSFFFLFSFLSFQSHFQIHFKITLKYF